MGAAMSWAAADTMVRYYEGRRGRFDDIDLIATGDLGWEGTRLLGDFLKSSDIDVGNKLTDCGLLIYDISKQKVSCGGSGCGCSAVVTAAYLSDKLRYGEIGKLSLIGTGAMMSTTSVDQGSSIPGIAHLVTLEGR